jgi:hypothetical protein
MTKHLLRDLENLKKQVLLLGSMVEGAILKATTALLERRPELALEVLHGDDAIDAREVAIEEECLKILALHQPVAVDLRYIVTMLKVNNDLERMGDLAGNIAGRAADLLKHDPIRFPPEFTSMVDAVRRMVHDSLDALWSWCTCWCCYRCRWRARCWPPTTSSIRCTDRCFARCRTRRAPTPTASRPRSACSRRRATSSASPTSAPTLPRT